MTEYPNAIQNRVWAPKTVSVIYSFQSVRFCGVFFSLLSSRTSVSSVSRRGPPSRPSSHQPPNPKEHQGLKARQPLQAYFFFFGQVSSPPCRQKQGMIPGSRFHVPSVPVDLSVLVPIP